MNNYLAELIPAVREHAIANYNEGGWDYVVECLEDSDIAELIGDNITVAGAIASVEEHIDLLHSVRQDIQGA